jgi:tRNA A37 N6-isopentenylltransferase MiaA
LDAIVRATWSLVRRQTAWFRAQPDVTWDDVTGRAAADVADEVATAWGREGGGP